MHLNTYEIKHRQYSIILIVKTINYTHFEKNIMLYGLSSLSKEKCLLVHQSLSIFTILMKIEIDR